MKNILMLLVLVVSGCSSHVIGRGKTSDQAGCVSVDDVLHEISVNSGDKINVCGVLRYQFEDTNLYADAEAAKKGSSKHCLAVASSASSAEALSLMNGKVVSVSGRLKRHICPDDAICLSYCSDAGIVVENVMGITPHD